MPVINFFKAHFKTIPFESFEAVHDLYLCVDIDYLGWVGNRAFGIQIKPVTAKANFGNYSATDRMKASFADFSQRFGGQVFVVFSVDDKIQNEDVVPQIADEINRLGKGHFE